MFSLMSFTWEKLVLGILILYVFLHSSAFFVEGAKLSAPVPWSVYAWGETQAGLSRLNRWNNFVDNPVLMPLPMSLFVFPVSRRACEVWLHSRVCHTWTSLWCTKGKLYKVQSPGLCLLFHSVFSGNTLSLLTITSITKRTVKYIVRVAVLFTAWVLPAYKLSKGKMSFVFA